MLEHIGPQLHRVGAVNGDVLAGDGLELVVKNLGVGLLLHGGEGEHPFNHRELFLFGQTGGKGVAVPGLALPGEGAEQVDAGLALFKGNGQNNPS